MLWASTAAPVADVNEYAVICAMGERADVDGCNSFMARMTLAERTKVDPKTVQRVIQKMEERRLIAMGDQSAAAYIRADRRPTVYDLLIPYSWLTGAPSFDRVRKFRATKGRPELTAELRPDIAAAPEKKKRSDVGVPRARRVDSKSTRESVDEGTDSPHGGTTSPGRVDSQSATGGLEDPRTITDEPAPESPANQPTDGRRPSTGSSSPRSGGSAAPDDFSEQVPAADIRAVVAGLPEPVRTALGKISRHTPLHLTNTVRAELLRGIPLERLIERAGDRWHVRGYNDAHREGKILRPIGVADALIRNDCTSFRCDDGTDIDTSQPCRTCERAREDYRKPA